MCEINHYHWLEKNLQTFFKRLNIECTYNITTAHGDKCYSYESKWKKHDIPFPHGVAIYLLSYIHPWSETVRNTSDGWKPVDDWVIEQYKKLKDLLPPL